jgi:hypothetical protein
LAFAGLLAHSFLRVLALALAQVPSSFSYPLAQFSV